VVNVVAGELFLGGAIVFLASVLLLAVGARLWADAATAAHRTRAHGAQADETQMTIQAVEEATEEVKRAARIHAPLPTDAELRAGLLAERRSENGHSDYREYTTAGNEGIEEEPAFDGGLYAEPG
jgi:hypothetical protein